eukprot:3642044-Rhodomonas_salina.2
MASCGCQFITSGLPVAGAPSRGSFESASAPASRGGAEIKVQVRFSVTAFDRRLRRRPGPGREAKGCKVTGTARSHVRCLVTRTRAGRDSASDHVLGSLLIATKARSGRASARIQQESP